MDTVDYVSRISGGIDSDGVRFFVADQPDGIVRTLDFDGAELGAFSVSGSPSGLAYDPFSNTLLVSDFDSDVVSRYTLAGGFVDDFTAAGIRTDGLTVVPIPEPRTGTLVALGLILFGRRRRAGAE